MNTTSKCNDIAQLSLKSHRCLKEIRQAQVRVHNLNNMSFLIWEKQLILLPPKKRNKSSQFLLIMSFSWNTLLTALQVYWSVKLPKNKVFIWKRIHWGLMLHNIFLMFNNSDFNENFGEFIMVLKRCIKPFAVLKTI